MRILNAFWGWLVGPKPKPPQPPVPAGQHTAALLAAAINEARWARGMGGLMPNTALDEVAGRHADWMAHTNILAHENIGDLTPARRLTAVGIAWTAEGECIAQHSRDAAECVHSWLTSPAHREILLGNYLRLGAGRAGEFWCVVLVL